MTIKLTPKQQTTAREFQAAIAELQQRQQAYLKAILDGTEMDSKANWTLSADCSELEEQGRPELVKKEA